MKLFMMWSLLVAFAAPAWAANQCYYYRDLPESLKEYRKGDKDIYETQGSMLIPKAVAKCSYDLCVAWVKCDNGLGTGLIKTKAYCKAKNGQCPSATECVDDPDVHAEEFKVAENLGSATRGLELKSDEKEGVE